jgi:pimeloyl-ACP methyl ester carboxylesterase
LKKYILSFLFIGFLFPAWSQQPIENWTGQLNVGGQKVELRLHLIQNADKSYTSNWDVPAQKAKGIPSSKTDFTNNQLAIEVKMIGASYSGKLNTAGDKIEGTWGQSGMSFPLNMEPFKADQKEVVVIKPQTPQSPFSYQSIDTIYQGLNTKLTYGATLTYPSDQKKHSLVILITGSGKQDRDETIMNHKPFAVLADYLTKKGFAVLRVDDRGAGKSSGDFSKSTSADFAMDVQEHIRYAKTLVMVDTNKIGLLGHSEGGMIAPMVATSNKSVAFVILMAGPGIEINEMMAIQNELYLKSLGVDKEAIDAYIPLYKNLMRTVTKIDNKQDAIIKANEIVTEWYKKTDKAVAKRITAIKDESDINTFATTMTEAFSGNWMKYFAAYNPQPALQKLKCPVLAINGSADIQVPAAEDLKAIESALKKAGNKHFVTKQFEGLNHLFQKCSKCTTQEYGELATTIEFEVLDYIGAWLVSNHLN